MNYTLLRHMVFRVLNHAMLPTSLQKPPPNKRGISKECQVPLIKSDQLISMNATYKLAPLKTQAGNWSFTLFFQLQP